MCGDCGRETCNFLDPIDCWRARAERMEKERDAAVALLVECHGVLSSGPDVCDETTCGHQWCEFSRRMDAEVEKITASIETKGPIK